ncbi:MAG: MoaD/ThiS family protein [Gemmatimonadota bacterium]|nr:MAG: MoaD/ThiS family protein [Gemmatimonadota bacterium]
MEAIIQIRCSLFARYAELAGCDSITVDVPEGATVEAAVAAVRERMPNGEQLPDRPMVAVNLEHAMPGTKLRQGDELALLPPLAGG